jgi:quercetin dioxygenase-like cupin family protein
MMLSALFIAAAAFTMAHAQMGASDTSQTGMADMGMMMMGEGGEMTVLAEEQLDMLPEGPLAWTALDLSGVEGEINVTSPAPGFLYASEGSHTVTADGEEMMLGQGESVFAPQGTEVSLESGMGLWHIVLADPEAQIPAGLEGAEVAFSSGELEDIPEAPVALIFALVDLPMMGSATTVHTHPGPEYIYVSEGEIEYETGLADTEMLTVGDDRALPADTAVQKRNPTGEPAAFLSWFVVDPEAPFAPETSFDEMGTEDEGMASSDEAMGAGQPESTVSLMPAAEHGIPEGFGEDEWLAARGAAFVTASDAGEDSIMVAASGLVPGGIYTMWWVIEEPEMEVGPAGGLPANTFTADQNGNAMTTITVDADHDYQTLLVAYHADYRTYGDEPGQMGEVTFSQLMGPFPRSAVDSVEMGQ